MHWILRLFSKSFYIHCNMFASVSFDSNNVKFLHFAPKTILKYPEPVPAYSSAEQLMLGTVRRAFWKTRHRTFVLFIFVKIDFSDGSRMLTPLLLLPLAAQALQLLPFFYSGNNHWSIHIKNKVSRSIWLDSKEGQSRPNLTAGENNRDDDAQTVSLCLHSCTKCVLIQSWK